MIQLSNRTESVLQNKYEELETETERETEEEVLIMQRIIGGNIIIKISNIIANVRTSRVSIYIIHSKNNFLIYILYFSCCGSFICTVH